MWFKADAHWLNAWSFLPELDRLRLNWLVMIAWREGGLTIDHKKTARVAGIPAAEVKKLWPQLEEIMTEKDGRWMLPEMWDSLQGQKKKSMAGQIGGKKSAESRTLKTLELGQRVLEAGQTTRAKTTPSETPKGFGPLVQQKDLGQRVLEAGQTTICYDNVLENGTENGHKRTLTLETVEAEDLRQRVLQQSRYRVRDTIDPESSNRNLNIEKAGGLSAHAHEGAPNGTTAKVPPLSSPPFDAFEPEAGTPLLGDALEDLFPIDPPMSRNAAAQECFRLGVTVQNLRAWKTWLAGAYPHKMPTLFTLKDSLGEYSQECRENIWETNPAARFTLFCCGHSPSQPLPAGKRREILSTALWLASKRASTLNKGDWLARNWTPTQFLAFWKTQDQTGFPTPASVLKYFDTFTAWLEKPEQSENTTDGEIENGQT